jgi:hypothetical protein
MKARKALFMDDIRSREDLLQALKDGARPNYLFFWGYKPLPNGEISRPCLSQWWAADFVINEVNYPTAEHFMMAEKARLFGDEEIRARILRAASPKDAKQLGRRVRNFDEKVWEAARFALVVEGNLAKFGQNEELEKFLLATSGKVLVEASPVDRIWGIGLAANDTRAQRPAQWQGLNLLGFALMEVRQRLQKD